MAAKKSATTKKPPKTSAVDDLVAILDLERLEQKGLVKSRVGDPTPQRGGKRKRHFEVAALGLKAVQASYRSIRNMADGLEDLLGELA